MKTKKLIAIILTCVLGLTLSACTSKDQTETNASSDASVSEKPAGEVKLELYSQKKEDVDFYNQILDDFMKEYPNIKIEQTSSVDGSSFVTRVAANDIPDIGGIFYNSTYFAMMDDGLFTDQTGAKYLDRIQSDIVNMVKYEDALYGCPITLNGYCMYYNVDIFNKYGLSVPTTIDELLNVCEQLKVNGVTPIAFPYKDTMATAQALERIWAGSVEHNVGDVTKAIGTSDASLKDYPEAVSYFESFYKLVQYTAADPLSTDTDDVAAMFANEEVAMVFNGTWGCSVYEDLNPELNFDTALVPAFADGIDITTCGTADILLAISSDSDVEASQTFLDYFTRDDVANKFAAMDRNPSVITSVNYEIEHLKSVTDAISEGKFTLLPSTYQPAGYRDELVVPFQSYLMDGDLDTFIQSFDQITDQFYNQ